MKEVKTKIKKGKNAVVEEEEDDEEEEIPIISKDSKGSVKPLEIEQTEPFILTEIPTDTALVIYDQVEKKSYDQLSALTWIMNKLRQWELEEE